MKVLATLFAIFAITQAAIYDCTIERLEDVQPIFDSCWSIKVGDLVVPATETLSWQLVERTLTFQGKLTFEPRSDFFTPLLSITGRSFSINATDDAVIDGQGAAYWDGQDYSESPKPVLAAFSLELGSVDGLKFKNCPGTCLVLTSSDNLTVSRIFIDNTDDVDYKGVSTHGIVISNSTGFSVSGAHISTEGGCVIILQASSSLISNIFCNGTLGLIVIPEWTDYSNTIQHHLTPSNTIQDITFDNITILNGASAINVSTSPLTAPGSITDLHFNNIHAEGIRLNAIGVSQDLWDKGHPANNIKITALNLANVTASIHNDEAVAVYINCAEGGCIAWEWSDVNIDSKTSNNCNYNPVGFNC